MKTYNHIFEFMFDFKDGRKRAIINIAILLSEVVLCPLMGGLAFAPAALALYYYNEHEMNKYAQNNL